MNKDLYSNKEFTELKKRLNREIQRRSTFSWWDPLTTPKVGEDRSSPLSLPVVDDKVPRVPVDDKTYTINTPSEGSIERTKNITYPAHGDNPSGEDAEYISTVPDTSAAHFTADEMRNFLVGLSKITDIDLFYGRDEIPGLAYRNPQGIEDALVKAESDVRHAIIPAEESFVKNDPNGGEKQFMNADYPVNDHPIEYPVENGIRVMPSGEYDGEETATYEGLGPNNFFDDYGAKPGDGDFHPYNRATTPMVRRDQLEYDDAGRLEQTVIVQGGIPTSTYGPNPRNPVQGNEYPSRPAYQGVPGTCNVACTGLCSLTCEAICSESCTSTCFSRCGNSCTATCGSGCTGCSTMCYTSCKTKCENVTGYACLTAGAKTVKISTSGGTNGEPAKNELSYTTYACQGCSYSCQFYPNKKTNCWDAGCMGNCFTSCTNACSASCMGGCIDNAAEGNGEYKTGKGRGCSGACTVNCVGICQGVCEGQCTTTCWHACKEQCTDNCTWDCTTNCGEGCANACTQWCTGCASSCEASCFSSGEAVTCTGCSTVGGCTSTCQHDCNRNCVGIGCKSICGIDVHGACEANCRINCMQSSCAALCSDACSNMCTTCVNTCGWQCGACTSECSASCGGGCEITCTASCEHSCDTNCVHSCSEECGGCSNLCYSCIGMCIGVCAVKCENGCSNCSTNCSWWCDLSCNQHCFGDCSMRCIRNCSGSCATYLESKTTLVEGPENDPTAPGYEHPHPKNREEERESFMLLEGDNDGKGE